PPHPLIYTHPPPPPLYTLSLHDALPIYPLDGGLSFSFAGGHTAEDIDATLEHLFRMLAETAADRKRRVVLIMDEFQEVVHDQDRSEEHTSELQSLAYLVCRLLLEKKKRT